MGMNPMTEHDDHFLAELKFSTDSGLRSILSNNQWPAWQRRAARELLDLRLTFADECRRIDQLGR